MGVGANGSRAGCTVRDLDCIYRETDKLYYRFARSCGLSESAYWVLYGVVVGGGSEVAEFV